MTTNQLRYAELQETTRHNLSTEGLTGFSYTEAARHNVEQERTNWYAANTSRMVGMGQVAVGQQGNVISAARQSEDARHNLITEGIENFRASAYGEQASATARETGLRGDALEKQLPYIQSKIASEVRDIQASAGKKETETKLMPLVEGFKAAGIFTGGANRFVTPFSQ
jgi:3-deoxy-D-arabino-heptulosonate 7-phosphate (DAHP) synthase